MKSVGWEDLTLTELPAYKVESSVQSRGQGMAAHMLNSFYLDMDKSSFDSEALLAFYKGGLTGPTLESLMWDLKSASPDSPWIVCSDIVNHWDAAKASGGGAVAWRISLHSTGPV